MAQNARVSLHGQLAAAGIAQTQETVRDLRDQADKVQRLQAVLSDQGMLPMSSSTQSQMEEEQIGCIRQSVSRRPVSMKSFLVFLLIAAAAPVLARYEEEYGSDGPGQIADINLLWYMLIGVGIWAVMVWEHGWRWRVWPCAYVLAMGASMCWRGLDGLGMLLMASCVVAMVLGIWQPWRR